MGASLNPFPDSRGEAPVSVKNLKAHTVYLEIRLELL
jgi:hypothetical protein